MPETCLYFFVSDGDVPEDALQSVFDKYNPAFADRVGIRKPTKNQAVSWRGGHHIRVVFEEPPTLVALDWAIPHGRAALGRSSPTLNWVTCCRVDARLAATFRRLRSNSCCGRWDLERGDLVDRCPHRPKCGCDIRRTAVLERCVANRADHENVLHLYHKPD